MNIFVINIVLTILLSTIVAFTIHKSSICVLPFYFISQIDITKKYIAGVLSAIPFLFLFKNQYFRLLGSLVGYEYDAFANRGAYGFTTVYFAVILCALLLLRYVKLRTPDYKLYYNALFMGALFLPLVFVNPAAMRVVQYFSLYLTLLLSNFILCFERRIRLPLQTAMILLLLTMTNLYSRSYEFFWQ